MKNIEDLSIADLKAAYDFTELDLKQLREAYGEVPLFSIPRYKEIMEVKENLFDELQNRTRNLV